MNKRQKLNQKSSSSSSSSGKDETLERLIGGLPPEMSQVVKMLREEFDNKMEAKIEANSRALTLENDKKIEAATIALRMENEALRKEVETLKNKGKSKVEAKKVGRNEKHLSGIRAFEKITAFELWREIIMYL